MAAVAWINGEIEHWHGSRKLPPSPAFVRAHEEPVVRHVVAVQSLAREAKHVEVGFSEKRYRLPARPSVSGLDQPEQGREILA